MNRISLTSIKVTGIALAGGVASVYAAAKVTDVVYAKTGDLDKAMAAGTLVGCGGAMATAGIAISVADNDADHYTDEDRRKAAKVNQAIDNATSGMRSISHALRLASLLSR